MAIGTTERARNEKAYQKSEWHFLGATLPQIRNVENRLAKRQPAANREEAVSLFETLWAEPVWEVRMVATLLLIRNANFLSAKDLPRIRDLVMECSGWAFNDMIGCHLLGSMVKHNPDLLFKMDQWAADPNLWIRRVAMQSLLLDLRRGDLTQWPRFVRYATPVLKASDFWTRKVIGWICRETSKLHPEPVAEFLLAHRDQLSGLTLREGAKYLSPMTRSALGLKS